MISSSFMAIFGSLGFADGGKLVLGTRQATTLEIRTSVAATNMLVQPGICRWGKR
jgi:hypothetical protein